MNCSKFKTDMLSKLCSVDKFFMLIDLLFGWIARKAFTSDLIKYSEEACSDGSRILKRSSQVP